MKEESVEGGEWRELRETSGQTVLLKQNNISQTQMLEGGVWSDGAVGEDGKRGEKRIKR